MTKSLALIACSVSFVAVVGCGDGDSVPRAPVKGQITTGGAPVSGATVVFENEALGVAQTATTDAQGNYEFRTFEAEGLPLGTYQVAVTSGRFMQPGEETKFVDVTKAPAAAPAGTTVPEQYAKAESSGLTAEVKEGNAPFNFDLKP